MTDAQAIAIIAAILESAPDGARLAGVNSPEHAIEMASRFLTLATWAARGHEADARKLQAEVYRGVTLAEQVFPCLQCRGTGIRSTVDSKEYCTCQLGKDLERLERKAWNRADLPGEG